jgi:coproporphyrinogen III oxidase-like Fe-S oxidoreductase
VDTAALGARYGIDVLARWGDGMAPYVEAGLAGLDGARLRLTRSGMLLANEVLAVFV